MKRNRLNLELLSATMALVASLFVLPLFSSLSHAADHNAPRQHASIQSADATGAVQSAKPIGSGNVFTDRSLGFSDPIAGNNTSGSTVYPTRRLLNTVIQWPSEGSLYCAVIDAAAGYAYFGTETRPGRVVKVALGTGANPPTRVGAVELNEEEYMLYSAVIDPAAGYAYFGTGSYPGRVVKVALGSGSNPPSRVGALQLNAGEDRLMSAVIDPAAGYAWFGTASYPGRVVKMALGSGSNPPSRVGAVTLNSGEDFLAGAVIDPAGGYAYFGTFTSPGQVVKVALGSGSNPPSRVGAVTLNAGEEYLWSGVIDPAAGYAYFGTDTSPGRVVKVALGTGANPPFRVGAVALNEWEGDPGAAVIDPAAGYAYVGTGPGYVVKVALGSGANPPSRVGAVKLNQGEFLLRSAVIDPSAGYAYFGTATDPGRVAKVALGVGANLPSRVGAVILNAGEMAFDFSADPEGWSSGGAPVVYTSPDSRWESGCPKMTSSTNTNTFGYWVSPQDAVPANENYLYRARFNVSTDITDRAAVPQIRLRANSSNFQQYDMLSIESAGQGDSSPATSGTDYDLYFVPPANETAAMLAFDLLNFNPFDAAVAELSLDTVTLERFELSSLSPTVEKDYFFNLTTQGWTAGGAPLVFTPPEYIHAGDALELRATTNTNTFGYWVNDPADITIAANRLYRGTFWVCTDVTDPTAVPEMRLRFNAGNFQASQTFGITSVGDGANSPGTTYAMYDRLYFLPPAGCVGEALIVSFDMLNFNPNDAATASLFLGRATIETLSPPSSP